jgi:glycogen synthase
MRVLHLTTEFPPVIYGGLGTAVGGWVTASARSGITVAVLLVEGVLLVDGPGQGHYGQQAWTNHGANAPKQAIINRDGVAFFQTAWANAIEAGVRVVHHWQPDIVHLHTAMLWPVAQAIQKRTGKLLIFHVHSVDRAEYDLGEEHNPWLAHGEAQEGAIDAADRLIALSESESELLADYYPKARSKIRILGNGIDESPSAYCAANKERRTDSPIVLYCGRLVVRKGISDLLTAIPQILERAPTTRFVLAGGPPPLTGDEVARHWVTSDLHSCRSQIHFTGWLSPQRVAKWYCETDILVVPSRYEPFGMVILEGMLHGLPIVASAVGGPAEILEDERTGLLFPPKDVGALVHALLRLILDPDLRQQLGIAAAAEVRHRWLWPHIVRKMKIVYKEAIVQGGVIYEDSKN